MSCQLLYSACIFTVVIGSCSSVQFDFMHRIVWLTVTGITLSEDIKAYLDDACFPETPAAEHLTLTLLHYG